MNPSILRLLTCLRSAVLALCSAMAASAHAEGVTYVLDSSHTQVTFEVLHLGTSTLRGRFNRIEGHITLDRAARTGALSVAVDTSSISTGVLPLDGMMRGGQFFNAAEHPKAYFIAQNVSFDGDKLASVRGEFTLRGVGQPLTLRAVGFNCYMHPSLQREVCGGDFEAEMLRSSVGINHSLPFVGDKVRLLIQVEGVRQ